MLGLEIFQILLVCLVLRRFLVLGQLNVVLFFSTIGLTLTCFALIWWQDLPSFTDDLSNFGE